MKQVPMIAQYFFYAFWSLLMTAMTYVLGGASLKALRHRAGRGTFWTICGPICIALFALRWDALAIAFTTLVLLIGVFSELEEIGLGFGMSAFLAVLMNSLVGGGAFALWVSATGSKWVVQIQTWLENLVKPLSGMNPALQINATDLMPQLPSVILILWIVALYLAVLLERRLGSPSHIQKQLSQWRLPDVVVWIMIFGLLGAFGNFENKVIHSVSINAINVCFVLFFFQGLAVVSQFFRRLKMGPFWQMLFMVVIVLHLFLFVSALGLVDYWADFRARMKNKGAPGVNREA
jgi:hypothetical protein